MAERKELSWVQSLMQIVNNVMSIILGKPSIKVEWFIKNSKTKWKWTAVRDCPDDLLERLNSDNSPHLNYLPSSAAPSPWKGFYRMDRIFLDGMHYDLQLEYGMGDEKSIMLTFDGFPDGSKDPTIHPVVVATKKS